MRSSSKKETKDVARHELIGLDVVVIAPMSALHGLSGKVVDETKHTFLVERTSGPANGVVVPKTGHDFGFRVGNVRVVGSGAIPSADEPGFVRIRGDDILFRPEDRTKKVRG